MAIVLNMTPEQEAQLAQEAHGYGLPVKAYATAKLLGHLETGQKPSPPLKSDEAISTGNSLDDWQKALDEHVVWIASVREEQSPETTAHESLLPDQARAAANADPEFAEWMKSVGMEKTSLGSD